jgi:long-chain acyl-CoA synthetase
MSVVDRYDPFAHPGGSSMPELANVADLVRVHAAATPDAMAYVLDGREVTYAELDERSSRVAQALQAAGVGAGDRVAILDKNCIEYYEVLFGAAKLNAVLVAVNWRLAPPEAAFIVNDSGAKVLVVGEELVPLLDGFEADLTTAATIVVIGDHVRRPSYDAWLAAQEPVDPGAVAGPDDVAFQYYSSGTTGVPKGVQLTNAACFASIRNSRDLLAFDDRSVSMAVMPQFHVAGGFWGLAALYAGRPCVLQREVDPAGIVRLIEEHRVTHAVFVPALLQFLVQVPGVTEADLTSMQCLVYGASPISEEVLVASVRTFDCDFLQAYGMTETSGGCVFLPPADHDPAGPNRHRLRAAGLAGPGTDIQVVDAELRPVPTGEVGEVLLRTAQNMVGYWNQPEETARTLVDDGWLRTGDAGYLDEDGYLYIHDRVKDMIISGGENVYPAEVENRLMAHPEIADVAVIGVPHDKWGETPLALVVRTAGSSLSEADVIAWAKDGLAHYKCPTSVEWRADLPRNPSGKLLKVELREPFWKDRSRRVG